MAGAWEINPTKQGVTTKLSPPGSTEDIETAKKDVGQRVTVIAGKGLERAGAVASVDEKTGVVLIKYDLGVKQGKGAKSSSETQRGFAAKLFVTSMTTTHAVVKPYTGGSPTSITSLSTRVLVLPNSCSSW